MKASTIDIEATLKKARATLESNSSLDPRIKGLIELLILIVSILCGRLKLDSKNSSKPPSQDPNRKKTPKNSDPKKPGGQKGRPGKTLRRVNHPDRIVKLAVDRSKLPVGDYKPVGYKTRQVFDFEVKVFVTEYQAEILRSLEGKEYTAPFPPSVRKAVQYGAGIKTNAVYMNCYQMASLIRIEDHFLDQLGIPVSKGSIYNFSEEAYSALESFETWTKKELEKSPLVHADETGINIDGKRHWLHVLCNNAVSLFHVDPKRGKEAMDAMAVLPKFNGVLCHDHWKPYFQQGCRHSLCNAHHVRELTYAEEVEGQSWAGELKKLLLQANDEVAQPGGVLSCERSAEITKPYREILARGEIESPPSKKIEGKRG